MAKMKSCLNLLVFASVLWSGSAAQAKDVGTRYSGVTDGGATWIAVVPENWNGTLLLWGRGYSFKLGEPEPAPADWQPVLLSKGYALAASNYGSAGWALEEAVPAQLATIAAFSNAHKKPARTIAWGSSMGGLVTTALAEQKRPKIDGAIAFCPSIGGAVGMMNMGLDGAFAFKNLVPDADALQLVGVTDDMANSKVAAAATTAALKTKEGRARLALAGVLSGIPPWTRRGKPQPEANDFETQVDEIGASFVMGTILPRSDQERRAGGIFSWNTGIDYKRQLKLSGRLDFVEKLYRKAGIELDGDLNKLANAPRISANRKAVKYMLANYTPTARPYVPIVSVQAIGDGLTSPSLQSVYVDAAPAKMARAIWLEEAGHCTTTSAQAIAALNYLETRLVKRAWPNIPAGTITHKPQPMMRACLRNRSCK